MAKFCHNCGSPLEGAPKFCPSCGTPLMAAPASQEAPAPQQEKPTAPPPQPQQELKPMMQQPPRQMPPQGQQMPPQPQMQPNRNPVIAPPPLAPKGPMPQQQMPPRPPMQGGAPMPMMGGAAQGQMPMQGQPPQHPMQNPPMQRQMPQPPMMQGPQGQPQQMMYQNAPGQNFGQQPYGQWPGQGMQNPYAPQQQGAFSLGPLGSDEGLVPMFLRYDGRLNRKPYIFRCLAIFCVIIVISIILGVIGAMMKSTAISMLGSVFSIVAAVPGVMLMIRRLHDLDRPTWWVVGGFIPLVNFALGLYLLCAEGTRGPNQFGPDPLEGQH